MIILENYKIFKEYNFNPTGALVRTDQPVQCRSGGLTDRQWCIQNGIPTSMFYYHVKALRKKACEIPETSVAAVDPSPELFTVV